MTIEEKKYLEAKAIIESDLAWHKQIEDLLVQEGINKKDIPDFISDAIDEKIDKKNKEEEKEGDRRSNETKI